MANEMRAYYSAGETAYVAVVRCADGYWYNGTAFEAPASAGWASYARTLSPVAGMPVYQADFPGGITSGLYDLLYFLQEGDDPAPTDPRIPGVPYLDWAGSAEKGVGTLQDLSAAQVQSSAAAALAAYDPPTKAELDAVAAAILAYGDINWVTATGFATSGDIPDTAAIADRVLGRNHEGGSDGGRTVAQALGVNRNKWTRSGGTFTAYRADDTTVWWSSTITVSASANPVTEFDPA